MRASLLAAFAGLALAQAPQPPQPQKVAITRVFPQPGQIGLFMAAADGSNEHPLVTPADIDYDAAWAPDGASIVFTSERNGSADLYRVKPDGTGLERSPTVPPTTIRRRSRPTAGSWCSSARAPAARPISGRWICRRGRRKR